ncbi:uncharacterized protein [Bemisia tabaci]|uniref:uncharacterized protein n=1 Tax=Bemisia tabaci TaxID=7038 RepID=UPI003B27DAFD
MDPSRFADGPLEWHTFTMILEIVELMKSMYDIFGYPIPKALFDSSALEEARELCHSNATPLSGYDMMALKRASIGQEYLMLAEDTAAYAATRSENSNSEVKVISEIILR